MMKNPQPVLQALFDNIRLPTFDEIHPRLVVLDDQLMERAMEMAVEEFGRYVPPETVRPTLRYSSPQLSFGILAADQLIGVYLTSEHSLRTRVPGFPPLDNRPGLQGEALVVLEAARGCGFGRILRQMLPEVGRIIGADYVWGGAIDGLQNLSHWLRRRVLVRSSGGLNITLEPIAADLKEALLPRAGEHLRDRWMGELGLNTIADDSFPRNWPAP